MRSPSRPGVRPGLGLLAAWLALALAGCPDPPPPPPPPPVQTGQGGAGGGQQGGGAGGGHQGGGDQGGGDQGGAGGGAADDGPPPAPWALVPEAARTEEAIYPMLIAAAEWPDPRGLRDLGKVPADKRPKPEELRLLEQLTRAIVAERLQPTDFQSACGVDAQGRTFVKLGRGKTQGSASVEVRRRAEDKRFDFPVYALALDDPAPGEQTLARLIERVEKVLLPGLGEEMRREVDGKRPHALEAHPQRKGADGVAAMAMLDRNGFGQQFPYLYAHGTEKHLLVLLQEVPFMSMDGKQ